MVLSAQLVALQIVCWLSLIYLFLDFDAEIKLVKCALIADRNSSFDKLSDNEEEEKKSEAFV